MEIEDTEDREAEVRYHILETTAIHTEAMPDGKVLRSFSGSAIDAEAFAQLEGIGIIPEVLFRPEGKLALLWTCRETDTYLSLIFHGDQTASYMLKSNTAEVALHIGKAHLDYIYKDVLIKYDVAQLLGVIV